MASQIAGLLSRVPRVWHVVLVYRDWYETSTPARYFFRFSLAARIPFSRLAPTSYLVSADLTSAYMLSAS